MNHFCRIGEVKVDTKLSAEEVYNIAKKYHRMQNIDGMIPKDINEAVYLDENNHITKGITWMIRSKLISNEKEQSYSDEEFYKLFDEDEIL